MSIISHIGMPGSFSHCAARLMFGPSHTYLGCKSFKDVFESVVSDHAEYGIIPIENSIAGSIYENYDLLIQYPLAISKEQYLKIEHFLLAKKTSRAPSEQIAKLQKIYSHPKALEQCRNFFESHPHIVPVVASDTATSAKLVANAKDETIAAIGSTESAHLYRLQVLARNIEDDKNNYTRFLYITKQGSGPQGASKCSLHIELGHKPGSLYNIIAILKQENLNMTKIESRPIIGRPFEYQFYIDFEYGTSTQEKVLAVIEMCKSCAYKVRVLGMYPAESIR